MKIRLRLIDAEIHERAKKFGTSTRGQEVMRTWSVPEGVSVVGTIINIRGTDFYVLEQFPARKAVNAAKKRMSECNFRKWAMGL